MVLLKPSLIFLYLMPCLVQTYKRSGNYSLKFRTTAYQNRFIVHHCLLLLILYFLQKTCTSTHYLPMLLLCISTSLSETIANSMLQTLVTSSLYCYSKSVVSIFLQLFLSYWYHYYRY